MADANWPGPIDRIHLIKAFRSRAPQVELQSGVSLNLTYDSKAGTVAFAPTRRFVFAPCGTYELATVTADEWLDQ